MSLIISVVGKSNSGKTTILEKLISELKRRGHTVAAMKHTGGDFQLDYPGKDSWRFTEAGSDAVVLASPHKLVFMEKVERTPSLEELIDFLGDRFDFIMVEGFKQSSFPKIEVHRKELGGGLIFPPAELLAVVTDEALDIPVTQFSIHDAVTIVDLLEKKLAVSSKVKAALPGG